VDRQGHHAQATCPATAGVFALRIPGRGRGAVARRAAGGSSGQPLAARTGGQSRLETTRTLGCTGATRPKASRRLTGERSQIRAGPHLPISFDPCLTHHRILSVDLGFGPAGRDDPMPYHGRLELCLRCAFLDDNPTWLLPAPAVAGSWLFPPHASRRLPVHLRRRHACPTSLIAFSTEYACGIRSESGLATRYQSLSPFPFPCVALFSSRFPHPALR
jgi:hypothetical protein